MGPDDWAAYRDVRLAALKEAPYAFSATWEGEKDRTENEWRQLVKSRNRFVAVADRRVLGMVGCAGSTYSRAADLTSLWVDPIARGQGVGDRLVAAVVEWAKEAGFVQVLLAVKVGNLHAETLYARNGFIRLETSTRGDEFEMSLRL